jgi:hypothetical protein
MIFVSFSTEKNIIPCSYCAPLFHLTSFAPTKSNLYLANSLASVVGEPDLYRLLTFYVLNLMSLFHCLDRTKVSVQVRGTFLCIVNLPFFTVRSCQHIAQPPSWRTPLVGCPWLLIQYIRSYPPYWSPFLHLQPEDVPCLGDRDPLIVEVRNK